MRRDLPVFLVSDRPVRARRLASGIDAAMPCRLIEWGQALPREEPSAWIIDCSPNAIEHGPSTWFETLRTRIARAVPCLYISRRGGVREEAVLSELGSPTVIGLQGQRGGLVSLLQQMLTQGREPAAPIPAQRHVETATGLVTRLFADAESGAAPRSEEADEGADLVLTVVAETGIRSFLDMVWRHDTTVYQHSLSVAGHSAAFAIELGFSKADRHLLAKAALLHDIGKARIPSDILNKPDRLTPEEMAVMRTHAAIGADILVAAGGFEPTVIDVARWHHERLDGSGYPDGLKGAAIGDLVRLVAICDVHSALTERRAYRAPLPGREALAVMEGMIGQIDGDLFKAYRPILAHAEAEDASAVSGGRPRSVSA